ncbi:hypothetical protein D9M73_170430 [compost metagenome]
MCLWPGIPARRLYLQVLPCHQGFQIGRLDDAQRRLDHPEVRADTGNALRYFGNARGEQDRLQIIAQVHLLDLADIQAFVADRRAFLQAIGALDLDRHHGAGLVRFFLILKQAKARDALVQWHVGLRGVESNATGHQALQ